MAPHRGASHALPRRHVPCAHVPWRIGMFGRFKVLQEVWKTGRLALRLARDSRTPMMAKGILLAVAVYIISPIDIIPDWFPFVGQADDILALLAGLNMFV